MRLRKDKGHSDCAKKGSPQYVLGTEFVVPDMLNDFERVITLFLFPVFRLRSSSVWLNKRGALMFYHRFAQWFGLKKK